MDPEQDAFCLAIVLREVGTNRRGDSIYRSWRKVYGPFSVESQAVAAKTRAVNEASRWLPDTVEVQVVSAHVHKSPYNWRMVRELVKPDGDAKDS